MALNRPIRWREGMFLRPQHFQQHDLVVETRDVGYFQAAQSFPWGLVRLDVQEEALRNFMFEVKALRAVLPDGTLVDVPENARRAARRLDPKGMAVGDALPLHVGVRRVEERRASALTEGAGKGESRFIAVEEEAFDLDVGRDPNPLEKLVYDLQLFAGDESTVGYEVMPLASVSLTGDPARPLQLTPGFAPPTLVLSASPALHGEARAVTERLASVLRDIAAVRSTNDAKNLILYQALAGYLPVIKDLAVFGNVHPREAYRELARLAGTLYYNDPKARPFDEIPGYDHQEPGPVFAKLRRLIHELSEPIFERPYEVVPMPRAGETDEFRVGMPARAKEAGVRIFLEIATLDTPAAKVRELMLKARISNPTRIRHLSQFALPGVATEMQQGPPQQLPGGRPPASYFRLKVEDGAEWATHVVSANELCLFLLGVPKDFNVNLILVFPGA